MNKNDSMGDRMKAYENCYRLYLPKRQSIIVRCDMRAGHTFTKGFDRPYDELFAQCMWETARQLCQCVSGCVFAYTQSDEISLVLVDYKSINTEPWFGNNLQKIVSISASMATYFFNDEFKRAVHKEATSKSQSSVTEAHQKSIQQKLCVFDARAFILPREEVSNYIYWRQTDCVRNSIQLAGQAYFSHNRLQGKSCDEIQEMLWQEKEINWSEYPTWFKNGVSLYKKPQKVDWVSVDQTKTVTLMRDKWFIDLETPMFSTCPNRINELVMFEE